MPFYDKKKSKVVISNLSVCVNRVLGLVHRFPDLYQNNVNQVIVQVPAGTEQFDIPDTLRAQFFFPAQTAIPAA